MKLERFISIVEGSVVCGESNLSKEVDMAFASDLMSDVLTVKSANFVLLTGLANIQSIRTAEMSDISCIIVCRGKEVTKDMIELAEEGEILVATTSFSMFKCAGLLYSAGVKPVY